MPHDCNKVRAAILREPWAILEEWLVQIIDIANREYSNVELAAAIREERAASAPALRGTIAPTTDTVAVVPVIGPIIPRGGLFMNASGATSIEAIRYQVEEALEDEDVDRIVLDFDSPGGQVAGVHELASFIRASCARKPITAYVSNMAASAAYWLACSCDRIIANRTAKVGCIGVMCTYTDDSAARKASGLKDLTFISSQTPNKNLDPKTPAGQREIQKEVDALAAIFIGEVARFRKVSAKAVEKHFGRGSVALADAALAAGMIDFIGTIETALTASVGDQANTISGGTTMSIQTGTQPLAGKNKPRAQDPEDDDDDDDLDPAAESKDPDDDDDKPNAQTGEGGDDDDDKAKKKARAKMKAAYPDVYQAGFEAGFEAYKKRINGIRSLGLVGHKALVEKAIFEGNMSVGEVAIAHAKADKKARQAISKGRLEETADINVPSASVPAGGLSGDEAEAKAVLAAMAGVTKKPVAQ